MMDRGPVLHMAPSPYHKYALDLLIDSFQLYGVKPAELDQTTSKQIYS